MNPPATDFNSPLPRTSNIGLTTKKHNFHPKASMGHFSSPPNKPWGGFNNNFPSSIHIYRADPQSGPARNLLF